MTRTQITAINDVRRIMEAILECYDQTGEFPTLSETVATFIINEDESAIVFGWEMAKTARKYM